jgi:hypothetical protein
VLIRAIRGKKSLRDRTEKIGWVVVALIRVHSRLSSVALAKEDPFAVKKSIFAVQT